MLVRSIASSNGNLQTFRGLYGEEQKSSVSNLGSGVTIKMKQPYFSFRNEGESSIASATKSMRRTICIDTSNYYPQLFHVERYHAGELPFTKQEYKAYKHFYGEKLPETLKFIEQILVEKNLQKYLNKGFVYNAKKGLHNFLSFLKF